MQTIGLLVSTVAMAVIVACGGGGGGGGTTAIGTGSLSVSGTVTGASSVSVGLVGAASATATTGTGGAYSFSQLGAGAYGVAPALAGYVFSPVSRAETVASTSVTGANFTATASTASTYTLSGTVSGAVAQGVVVTLTGAATGATVTDANGHYSFPGLANGTYRVTPVLSGFGFTTLGNIALSGANSGSNNVVASAVYGSGGVTFTPVAQLPDASVGSAYSQSLVGSISGGTAPYHYESDSFATGAPPLGMLIDLGGHLVGTPSVAGTYTFGVCAVDLGGNSDCRTTTIVVKPTSIYTGTFDGSGGFARAFPAWGTTCHFTDIFSGTITVTITTLADGTRSSSVDVEGDFDSSATSGSTSNFTCESESSSWTTTVQGGGTLPAITWTDAFTLPSGTNVTGTFTGTLSGDTITGTQVETMDTSSGSATLAITLTKQ